MHSSKHFDPQLGLDIHFFIIPPLPAPVPLPCVHISLVFDPFDYVPFIGGTVQINGVKRATAGTGGISIHIPFMAYHPAFEPEFEEGPQDRDELFMGSKTVVADGNPLSRITMPVLGCNIVGLINPFRPKKPKIPQRSLVLPTTINLAIPNNVFVGGPPTISMMGLAFSAGFAALGKLRKLKRVQAAMERVKGRYKSLFKNMDSGFLKCKVLRAEPVDIRTGAVEVTHEDFSIPGRLPLTWTRRYRSDDLYPGLCGHGWQTPADTRLELYADGSAMFFGGGGVFAVFDRVPQFLRDDMVEDGFDGARLTRVAAAQTHELHVRTKDDLLYVFDAPLSGKETSAATGSEVRLEIQRLQDLHGNYWNFERQGGHLTRINESGIEGSRGRFLDISAQRGRIHHIALHDPASGITYPLVRYSQDEAGDLVAVYDALDAARTFQYQASPHPHRMVRHTDRVGLSFYYAYDDRARVVRAWGDGGLHKYTFVYNDLINETQVTDSLGHTSLVKFDGNGLPLCEIDPLGGCTFFEYDEWARTTAVTDPEGLRTEFEYDERGNLICLTRPDDSTVATEYDLDNRPVAITAPGGAIWRQDWNERGRLIKQTLPLGADGTYDYDILGQLIQQTNPRGAVTRLTFDRYGQLQQVTDALGHSVRFEHDAMGNLLERIDAGGSHTSYQYDRKGRLLQATLPGGTKICCEYDAEDQLVRYIDESGNETNLEYVGIGQIARRLQPDGHSVRYQYDTEEQLITVINQRGERYGLQRDALGRIVTETDYWNQSRHYSYDSSGRIRRSVDPLGRGITFDTDKLGRITRKTFADVVDATHQTVETFRYDITGNLVEMGNVHSKVARRFDAEGRLIEEVQNGFKVQNEYDAVGSRVLRTTSAGNRVAVEYDLRNAPVRITINDETPILIERDAEGRAITEQLSQQLRRSFAYTDNGQLAAQTVYKNSAPIFDTRFDYDRSNNLLKRIDSELGSDTYRYDPMGRVIEHTDPMGKLTIWLNDSASDRLSTQVRETSLRKVVGGDDETQWSREGSYGGQHYVFDRAGNMVRRTNTNIPGRPTLHLTWDANQRLHKSSIEDIECRLTSTLYGYDPLGRRLFKRSLLGTIYFFWDNDSLVAEISCSAENSPPNCELQNSRVVDLATTKSSGWDWKEMYALADEYVYRPGTFEPLATVLRQPSLNRLQSASADTGDSHGSYQVAYFNNDVSGAPIRLLSAEAKTLWAAAYQAWGKAIKIVGDADIQNLRLQGQYADGETGFHYNRHRYFDPMIGQFISPDALGQIAGTNTYRYGWNSHSSIDPLGLMPWPNPINVGHHLVPQNLARSVGGDVGKLLGTNRNTPTFFFKEPYQVGAHEGIHAAQKPFVGRLQGSWHGTGDELIDAAGKGLGNVDHIRGDLRIPSTGEVLARDVTPSQAFGKLKAWFEEARKGC